MTNAELIATIRNEIERRKEKHSEDYKSGDTTEFHRIVEDDAILSFLSTLESGKPMNPSDDGLKKEIDAYFKDWYVDESDQGYILKTQNGSAVMGDVKNVARHFYEIGCRRTAEKFDEIEYNRQMAEERQMEKEIPNDLEEAARHSEILTYPMPEDGDIEKVFKVQEARVFHEIGFIAGAKWQAEQDKETIELAEDHAYLAGAVNEREKMLSEAVEVRVQTSPLNGPLGISAYCCNFPQKHPFYHCKEGDKVRLIIVKED